MKHLALATSLVAASAFAQQAPDILIPNGSTDGAYILIDRDKDGKYTADGEAYDFILAGFNSSPRNYVKVGTRIYFTETGKDQIVWVEDTNKDGCIQTSERHVFHDALAAIGACRPNWIVLDKNGWFWWTNDDGTAEGLYRSKDLNNDGDADDTNETVGVIVEPKTVVVANTPKTAVTNLAVTSLQSIYYDANYGTNGRFLFEEENWDQTIAMEDKNSDGDFDDTGEVYLFSALWTGGVLAADVNPDVTNKVIPSGTEMRDIAWDIVTKAYYLLSADSNTSSHPEDHGLIYVGKDGNSDGDINDAGETKVFFDCSHNSNGPLKNYNFIYGMTVYFGKVYIMAEFDGTPDNEHLIVLEDKNRDGDANDAGEATVLWTLPRDRVMYKPAIFPPGTFVAKQGLPGVAVYYGGATCRTSLSATSLHNIQFGTNNWDNKPVIGNTNFHLRTWGAKAAAPGLYLLGIAKTDVPLDAGGTCRLLQTLNVIFLPFATDATGAFNLPFPIPNDTGLVGMRTYWQSVVIDTTAPAGLGFTVSDAFDMRFGSYSYSIELG